MLSFSVDLFAFDLSNNFTHLVQESINSALRDSLLLNKNEHTNILYIKVWIYQPSHIS